MNTSTVMPTESGVSLPCSNIQDGSNKTPSYNELMKAFQSLAAYMSKRNDLRTLCLGVVLKMQRIVDDSSALNSKNELLSLADNIPKVTTTFLSESYCGETEMNKYGLNEPKRDDLIGVPMKRGRHGNVGRVNTKRLKNVHERVPPKTLAGYGLCGKEGHRVNGGCPRRQEFGVLVKDSEIDELVHDLTNKSSPRFRNETIPVGASTVQQVHPKANYICIRGFGNPQVTDMSQNMVREDMNYLRVTVIFDYGIVTDSNNKRFIRTAKVTSWMRKSAKNKKRVIICKDA